MKINSISSFNFSSNNLNFKRTAVPYPEYINAYKYNAPSFENVLDKVSALFSPSITAESSKIKSNINNIYEDKTQMENKTPKDQLLSVFA